MKPLARVEQVDNAMVNELNAAPARQVRVP